MKGTFFDVHSELVDARGQALPPDFILQFDGLAVLIDLPDRIILKAQVLDALLFTGHGLMHIITSPCECGLFVYAEGESEAMCAGFAIPLACLGSRPLYLRHLSAWLDSISSRGMIHSRSIAQWL